MCFNYKLRVKSSRGLCKSIENNASKINNKLTDINKLEKDSSKLIRELKKLKISTGKLEVQPVKPKKETKELKNLYKSELEEITNLNKEILKKYLEIICSITEIAFRLNKITFDADSLIYREDHRLSLLIKKLIGKKQSHKIIFKLNILKGLIKTAALRIFQASKFQQKSVLKYPLSITKAVGFGSKIKQLSSKIWNLEKTIEKEGMKNIDNLIKESREELNYLKKLELDILMIMPVIEKKLIDIENDAYLFHEDYAKKLKDSVNSAKEKIQKIKNNISERAQDIFEEIELIAESK